MKRIVLITASLLLALSFYVKHSRAEEAKAAKVEVKKSVEKKTEAKEEAPSVMSVAKEKGLNKFVKAVKEAELYGQAINSKANFMVFAPNDAAFAKYQDSDFNRDTMRPLMKYHVVPQKDKVKATPAKDLSGSFETFAGGSIEVASSKAKGDADSVANIVEVHEAPNGVIYVLDAVLKPTKPKE